jgi:hypothetical protein
MSAPGSIAIVLPPKSKKGSRLAAVDPGLHGILKEERSSVSVGWVSPPRHLSCLTELGAYHLTPVNVK